MQGKTFDLLQNTLVMHQRATNTRNRRSHERSLQLKPSTQLLKLSDLPTLLFEATLEEDSSAELGVESEGPEEEEEAGVVAFEESLPLRSLKIFSSGESGESFKIATKAQTSN